VSELRLLACFAKCHSGSPVYFLFRRLLIISPPRRQLPPLFTRQYGSLTLATDLHNDDDFLMTNFGNARCLTLTAVSGQTSRSKVLQNDRFVSPFFTGKSILFLHFTVLHLVYDARLWKSSTDKRMQFGKVVHVVGYPHV
jgi:hypothetical protein